MLWYLVLFLFYCSVPADALTLKGRLNVIDGDTVKILGERVRLLGIDAPEIDQHCKNAAGRKYACGRVSAMALSNIVQNNLVRCEGEKRDSYGRLLGVCYVGTLELNGWMVRNGYALNYSLYSNRYVFAEKEARAAKRGLWSGEFVVPWDWRKGSRLVYEEIECYRSSVKAPAPLLGNHGEIIVMGDGTIWEIVGGRHRYMYEYYPSVKICPKKGVLIVGNEVLNVVFVSRESIGTSGDSIIESRVDGQWGGWNGETVVKLANRQVWIQDEYRWIYWYRYRPRVMVVRKRGVWQMQVEGRDEWVRVRRLR